MTPQSNGEHVDRHYTTTNSCPCHEFDTIKSIYEALDSEQRTHLLVNWLSSEDVNGGNDNDHPNHHQCRRPCSGYKNRCIHRVRASFTILNAIRAACRPFLEASKFNNQNNSVNINSPSSTKEEHPQTYEEKFPSLGSSSSCKKPQESHEQHVTTTATATPTSTNRQNSTKNDLKENTKNGNNKIKKKKRIRPVAAVAPTVGSAGVWSQIASSQPSEQQQSSFLGTTTVNAWGTNSTDTNSSRKIPTPSSNNRLLVEQRTNGTNHPLKIQGTQKNPWGGSTSQTLFANAQNPFLNAREIKNVKTMNSPSIVTPSKHQKGGPLSASHNNPTTPTASHQHVNVLPASQVQVNRFVKVYCTLLQYDLIPSTALEMQLLLRLLCVSDDLHHMYINNGEVEDEIMMVLAPIFYRPDQCQSFAAQVLQSLPFLTRVFGVELTKNLIKIPHFRKRLPDLTSTLESEIEQQQQRATKSATLLLSANHTSLMSSGKNQTAMLTLPFQQDRDSRHNYKTRDEQMIYKNREESRDAFLYQLRAFLNVRGKVLDTVQANKSIQRIRSSSRMVVGGVMSGNMQWFAQFYCDLLLQVGLVPLEETDKELLDIASKDKLQVRKRYR